MEIFRIPAMENLCFDTTKPTHSLAVSYQEYQGMAYVGQGSGSTPVLLLCGIRRVKEDVETGTVSTHTAPGVAQASPIFFCTMT